MSALPVVLLAAAALLLGRMALELVEGADPSAPAAHGPALHGGVWLHRAVDGLLAGLVILHLLLVGLDLAGIPWRRRTLAAAVVLALGLLVATRRLRRQRRGPARQRPPVPLGWGDGVALVAVTALAGAALHRRIAIPDLVYHWGIKARRYLLAGGVDRDFLADPLRPVPHPDYPDLLPSLYAATGHLRGFFDEVSMLLWSAVFLVLVAAFARRALERGGARGGWLQSGVALVALVGAMFTVAYDLAGGADPLVALALVAALPHLLRTEGSAADPSGPAHGDLRVGLAAALAAGAKIEGVALAAVLVAARLWAEPPEGTGSALPRLRRVLRRLPRLTLPALAVTTPWLVACLRHGLFQATNTGSWDPARLSLVVPAVGRALATPEWHGFAWLLLTLPLLLLRRRLRPAAAVLLLQLALYLAAYLTAPVDTRFYVLSSLPRLLAHLVPAALVLVVLELAPQRRPGSPRVPHAGA